MELKSHENRKIIIGKHNNRTVHNAYGLCFSFMRAGIQDYI